MQHPHPEGTYTAACRACRMNVQLDHIREPSQPASVSALSASRATTGYAVARELVGRHIWSSGQRRAIKMAATLGISALDLSAWVEAASREVNGTAQRMAPEQVDGRTGCPGCDSGGEHNP